MISILIPAKDYDCHLLVEELHRQGEEIGIPYEIIVGEDGTSPDKLHLNITAEVLPNCRRITREKNIGRANIRNLLALEAKYPYIIFIDCDAIAERENFLKNYIEPLRRYDVVCGGLYHADRLADRNCTLRFTYEKNADKGRSAETRNKRPYDKFSTFNFGIRKELFLSIFFDNTIEKYGYEDTLFGKELEKRGNSIIHIDNPLLHNGLEDNATYLGKVEQSLYTLAEIKEKIAHTPLLDAVEKLRKWHLTYLFMAYWKYRKKRLRRNLLGKHPSLKKLNIYKLGYFLSLLKQQGKSAR